jgi:cytochrome d ubiquinol oxidase subunit II
LWLSLVIYALTGGADFGGGVWDLFATGPRARDQRRVISEALAPIWEANHVWLIVAVVVLFVGFPTAYAGISTFLHIPLTAMLLGTVFRGATFVFRSHETGSETLQRRWGYAFSVASTITPIFFGISTGTIASGALTLDPASARQLSSYVTPWLAPFPVALGFFTLALYAYLAAVYLTLETRDRALQDDFRLRALVSGIGLGAFAWISLWTGKSGAPLVYDRLLHQPWSMPFHALTGAVAIAALAALYLRRFRTARTLAVMQAILIFSGWAFAQHPYLVVPSLTITAAAAPDSVLAPMLSVLAIGALLVLPAFGYLFYVFKQRQLRSDL